MYHGRAGQINWPRPDMVIEMTQKMAQASYFALGDIANPRKTSTA